tara:strand:+ start:4444 stop:5046 length:603 start_codon:yes stop_codon:yes gene_type:complete
MSIKKYLLLFLVISSAAESRPISYSGGSTLMAMSDNMKSSLFYHYSPSYNYSIGLEAVDDKYFDKNYSYARLTYLMNRKNTFNSQRNLYFQSGIGSNGRGNHFIGVHGDWETRRVFFGFGLKKVESEMGNYSHQYYQFGIAPYIGEYGDLHTWMFIKTKQNSLDDEWSTYPTLKFFKGDYLIEFGYNSKTSWDVHLMRRF